MTNLVETKHDTASQIFKMRYLKMKKSFIFLLCSMLSVAGCAKQAKPESSCPTLLASGTTGELTWELCEDGTLTISGKGEMPDYNYDFVNEEYHFPSPWYEYRENIIAVIIGDEVSNIGINAFYQCSKMTSIAIGNSVTVIGSVAFRACVNLKTVDIPNSVTTIGGGAFAFCYSLASVSIGKSATIVGDAFRMCTSLTQITNYREIPQTFQIETYSDGTANYPFIAVDLNSCILLVSAGSVEAYKVAEVWKNFVDIKAIQ